MNKFESFADIEVMLSRHAALTATTTGRQITVERTKELMQALGNPEKSLKIIHVAGTSGKTSTSYYIASMLQTAGKKVGLTVSPHVDTVRERLQINLEPVNEEEFIKIFNEFYRLVELSGLNPTYFELLIAMAYWYFAKEQVDYAVIETGMGGLHDSTNVAEEPDKVCVIADIGLDHTQVLGATLKEIARQKAGIIHSFNKVFMYRQNHEVNRVVEECVEDKQADFVLLDQDRLMDGQEFITGIPKYQQRNWLLARSVYDFVAQRDGFGGQLSSHDLLESQDTEVPGRMEESKIEGVRVVMDGAHNQPKMSALVESFKAKYPGRKVPVLLALKQGKEFMEILPLLKDIASSLVVTEFNISQDVPFGAIDAHELAEVCRKLGFELVFEQPDPALAFKELLNQDSDLVLVTGSFYLIGQLRNTHEELKHV